MRLIPFLLIALLPGLATAQVWEKPIAPGLTYRMEVDASGPRLIHALRWSLNLPDVKAISELAGGTINEDGTVKGRLTPAKMREQADALAAINGDFFSFDHGAPIGLMIRNGEIVTSPARARATFAWGTQAGIGLPSWAGKVFGSGKDLKLDSVNQQVGQNQIGLYSAAAGKVVLPADGLAVLLKLSGKLAPNADSSATVDFIISDAKTMTVEKDTVIVVARGTKSPLLTTFRPKEEVKIRVDVSGFDLPNVAQAIGGGPFLVRKGLIAIDAAEQGFNASFRARHPRTAVGRTAQNDILFVAIDGRQAMSIGASLDETAAIMQRLGCVDAINLDGGGSTSLNILGVTVNRPSDKAERPVSNGVLFLGAKPAVTSAELSFQLPKTLVVGETSELKVLTSDGSEIPNSEVIWAAHGAGWIDQGGTLRALEAGSVKLSAFVRGKVLSSTISVQPKQ